MSSKRIQEFTEKTTLVANDLLVIADSEDLSGSWLKAKKITKTTLKTEMNEKVVTAIGSIGGGTQDLDLDLGYVFSATVDTATTTFTFSNPPSSGLEGNFKIILTNGGSQTVNWPASVDWAGGTPPSLTAAGVDVLEFMTVDAGTTWYGHVLGLDFS